MRPIGARTDLREGLGFGSRPAGIEHRRPPAILREARFGMGATLTLLDLAGAVALLLWGAHMIQTGIQRAFGPDLRRVLGMALGNRLKAFGAGLGVTAILQSSTATGLMAASFAAGGLVDLVPALAVMLGANVGTTLIVQLLSFDISRATPVMILVGVIMFRRGGSTRTRDLGRVAIGLGLMLTALVQLLEVITPYSDVPSLRILLGAIQTDPLIDVILAAAMTWAAHSSVAVVLLVMSFTAKGVVSLHTALALVLGANIGTALNPLLEGSTQGDAAGKRLVVGNLLTRLMGCVIALPLLNWLTPLLAGIEPDLSRAVADFHTAFNLALALLFLPLLGPASRLLRRWLPDRIAPDDPSHARHLDRSALVSPPLALGNAAREALRMADVLEAMLRGAADALGGKDRDRMDATRRMDDVLDRLNASIKTYLTGLDPEEMVEADERRLAAILVFATNLEQAGDVIDRNVMAIAAKRLKRAVAFSPEGRAEIHRMFERLETNVRTAAGVFMTEDARAARLLSDEKTVFRDVEAKATRTHFEGLRNGSVAALEASALHIDLLQHLKRINDHLVSGAAYPVLESRGELMATRLRRNPPEDAG